MCNVVFRNPTKIIREFVAKKRKVHQQTDYFSHTSFVMNVLYRFQEVNISILRNEIPAFAGMQKSHLIEMAFNKQLNSKIDIV